MTQFYTPQPPTQTFLNGQLIVEDREYSGIGTMEMVRAGKLLAEAFPSFTIWVTAGPHRFYDVAYHVDWTARVISLDFYSVRPGLFRLPELIREIQVRLADHGVEV